MRDWLDELLASKEPQRPAPSPTRPRRKKATATATPVPQKSLHERMVDAKRKELSLRTPNDLEGWLVGYVNREKDPVVEEAIRHPKLVSITYGCVRRLVPSIQKSIDAERLHQQRRQLWRDEVEKRERWLLRLEELWHDLEPLAQQREDDVRRRRAERAEKRGQ